MYDVLIKQGEVVDGTGSKPFVGDIAIKDGRIVEIGQNIDGKAARTIEAEGKLVTPGFVDVHTHYDGQVTWDEEVRPSSDHGVTTVVMGCCGVGFAPVKPGSEEFLIQLMEGVEDIPGTALSEGMDWSWESFPEYLDALGKRQYTIDIAAQVPHGALRFYVMGERGANDEPGTEEDVNKMARLVGEALEAGAVGFTSSRVKAHQAVDGRFVPGTLAPIDELMAIAHEMGRVGSGVFELIPSGAAGEALPGLKDQFTAQEEMQWMSEFSRVSGRPVTFTLVETYSEPETFRELLELQDEADAEGLRLHGQFPIRPTGVLTSLEGHHAFTARPTYKKLAKLPLAERVAELRKPEIKQAILSEPDQPESDAFMDNSHLILQMSLDFIYRIAEPVNYEPDPRFALSSMASAAGRDPLEMLYDLMLEDDGKAVLISLAANYKANDLSAIEHMMKNANAVPGLSDGGAHCKIICDASSSTYMLTHWARDRHRGPQFPIEYVVKKHTSDTASLYGFTDRGELRVGKRADINVIDFERLAVHVPKLVHDLPTNESRYLQESSGYEFTLVNGVVIRENDKLTGARPGRLIRG